MTKPDPIDPKTAFAEVFKRLDGIKGMTSWAKTHRTLFYGLFAKLISQPLVQNNVNVKIADRDGEAARRELEATIMRMIEDRTSGLEHGTVIHGGEVIYRDPQPPVPRPPLLGTRVVDHQPRVDAPVTADPRPQPAATTPPPAADVSRPAADDTTPPSTPQPSQPINNKPNTTQLFYEWAGNSRSTRISPKDWGPV